MSNTPLLIAESPEFTSFLGSRGVLTKPLLNLSDILMGLQFFYPFKIYLRKRDSELDLKERNDKSEMDSDDEMLNSFSSTGSSFNHFEYSRRRRPNFDCYQQCEALVFEIKLEPARDSKGNNGAILWMFSCFNDYFYFDAKHLLRDMKIKCNSNLISEDDNVEFPYGMLAELVYHSDNGIYSLQDLLLHKEDANVFTFPWPATTAVANQISVAMKEEVNQFCKRDGESNNREKFITTENLRKLYANPYQTDVRFPDKYCCWRGLVTKNQDKKFDWTHRGFIVSVEDKFGNKCSYIHPKLTMYFHSRVFGGKDGDRDQHRYCVRNIYPIYSKKPTKTTEETDDMLRKELLYYIIEEFAKPQYGESWIALKDVIPLFLNNLVRLPYDQGYTTTLYDEKSKLLHKQLRLSLVNATWKSMREDGIIKVENLSVSPLQYQKDAVLVWTESKQEIYVRKVSYNDEFF